MEISGQMALVSGGGSGLGAATARHLKILPKLHMRLTY